MKRHFENLTSKASRAVRHWWIMMLLGILCMAIGVAVFVFPLESYVTLGLIVGVLMILTGIGQLFIAVKSRNYLTNRGYFIVGCIADLLIGIFLCVYPGITLALLPVMVGIWLLYHSFMIISFGGDLETFRIDGGGLMMLVGTVLLLLSLLMLINPFMIGIETVVIITGVGFILLGLISCAMALKLKDIDKYFEREYPR